MIVLAFVVFLASVALLGWLLPRFAGRVAAALWERRLARRQRRLEREPGGVEVELYGAPYLMSGPEYLSRTSGNVASPAGIPISAFTMPPLDDSEWGPYDLIRNESGAAMPSALGVLTVVAFGYIGFLAVRQILRVAGALP